MEEIAPFLIGALCMMIPIVAILTNHQQKMARILHGQEGQSVPTGMPQVEQLRYEVNELKQALAQQTIAIDSLAAAQDRLAKSLTARSDLEARVGFPES